MPRSWTNSNGDLLRCDCGKLSLRLPGLGRVLGCDCPTLKEILGAVPDGCFPVIDERDESFLATFVRYQLLDREAIRVKDYIMSEEDKAVFRAVAMAGCPEGCIFVDEEREEP